LLALEEEPVSDFLFARPSFWSGAARALDLGATFNGYNQSRTPELADARALYNDWRAVGEALLNAYYQVQDEVIKSSAAISA
jgi:hypothetical protein